MSGFDPEILGGGSSGGFDMDATSRNIESMERHYRKWTDTTDTPSIQKTMAAYAMGGQDKLDPVLAAHPNDWQKNIPASAQQMVLTINNNTGGNAVAVLNAQQ